MKIIRIIFLLCFPLYLISCSNQKKIPFYLDNAGDTTLAAQTVPQLRIQKNDLLSIAIYSSSTAPSVDAPYNLPPTAAETGFLVDMEGNINYPRIGTIKAEGLTKQELAEVIKKRLNDPVVVLSNPTVVIRFQNYRVTVLGQVAREGVIALPGEKVTILEAIGLAGGVTDYGNKDRVKVVRETEGKVEIGFINLASDSLFQSPYYHLAQNDVLIVPPNPKRLKQADQAVVAQRISLALGIITSLAFIYNIFR